MKRISEKKYLLALKTVQGYLTQVQNESKIVVNERLDNQNFDVRTKRLLYENNISTIFELMKYSRLDLESMQGLGSKTISELEYFLEDKGFRLRYAHEKINTD